MFCLDANGKCQDAALHADMLDDDEAEEQTALEAVLAAMAEDGMSAAEARDLSGTADTAQRLAHFQLSPDRGAVSDD